MAKKSKSVEAVLEELKNGIRKGKYVPGQRLITSDVAVTMKTSLAPVREAIHMLAGEGLVEIVPNRGASVRTLSPKDLIDGIQVLQVVGDLGFKLFWPHHHRAELADYVKDVVDRIETAGSLRDRDAFFETIAESHRQVNDFTGNQFLNPVIDRLHLRYFYRQMSDLLPPDYWEQYIRNYKDIGDLMIQGDLRNTRRIWNGHCKWLIKLLSRNLD